MGCLRALFVQVGCLVLLVAAAVLGFLYRDRLWAAYRHLRGRPDEAALVFAQPAAGGATRATHALEGLARHGGPAYVDLEAEDLAALVDEELGRSPRRVFDSVTVALGEDEIRIRGLIDLSEVPERLLGPLASGFSRHEPVEAGGPLAASGGGVSWTIAALRIRDFPFPRRVIPSILRALRVAGADGASVPLPGTSGVGDVRVSPGRVRLYRLTPQ